MMLQFQMMLQLHLSVKLLVNDAAFAIVMLLQLKLSMLLQLKCSTYLLLQLKFSTYMLLQLQ